FLGLLTRFWLKRRFQPINVLMPLVSIMMIVLLVACIVGLSKTSIASAGPITLFAVILHNLLGMLGGYGFARLCGLDKICARTIAIEVSVQASGLGIAL